MSISARRLQTAVYRSATAPPPTEGTRHYKWGYSANGTEAEAVTDFGPPEASRTFYSGGLPPAFIYPSSWGPYNNTEVWVSFKTVDSNTSSYAASAPPGTHMIFHHEPEGPDYPNGAAFVAEFITASNAIRAGNPNIPVVMTGTSYHYRSPSGAGWDGSYIPPAEYVDMYTLDMYEANHGEAYQTITPIQQNPSFQRWYSLVQPMGKPIGFTEYGLGTVDDTGELAGSDTLRAQTIPQDAQYLNSLPNFKVWLYWWESGAGDGAHWAFHDQPSIDAWKAVGQKTYVE